MQRFRSVKFLFKIKTHVERCVIYFGVFGCYKQSVFSIYIDIKFIYLPKGVFRIVKWEKSRFRVFKHLTTRFFVRSSCRYRKIFFETKWASLYHLSRGRGAQTFAKTRWDVVMNQKLQSEKNVFSEKHERKLQAFSCFAALH